MDGFKSPDRISPVLEVTYDGRVTMREYESVSMSCDLNMTYYPADSQECINVFGTYPPSTQSGIIFTNVTFTRHQFYEDGSEYSLVSLEVNEALDKLHHEKCWFWYRVANQEHIKCMGPREDNSCQFNSLGILYFVGVNLWWYSHYDIQV